MCTHTNAQKEPTPHLLSYQHQEDRLDVSISLYGKDRVYR